MSSPHASAPIPAGGRPTRKRSRVMQSSLDLVFSYSRSQQLLYGQNLHSAPSFLDVTSTSISSPSDYGSVRVSSAIDLENGITEDGDDENSDDDEGVDDNSGVIGEMSLASADSNADGSSPTDAMLFQPDSSSFDNEEVKHTQHTNTTSQTTTTSLLFPGSPEQGWRPGMSRSSTYRIASVSTIGSGSTSKTVRAPDGSLLAGRTVLEDISPTQTPGVTERTPLLASPKAITSLASSDSRRRSSVRRMSSARRGTGSGFSKRRESRLRRGSMVRGESTDGQTLFNAVAVLLGIGLLSLPLAFSYAGWISGTVMLLGFAWITCHTAKLLAQLISADSGLMGYTDIGRLAFGGWGSLVINLLFCLELFGLGVALIVLFGDTLQAIFPQMSSDKYKIIGFCLVFPTTLLPLRLLSLPSLLSTLSTFLLIVIILIDGFAKTEAPGSILHSAPTDLWPETLHANWLGGIGLVLAGFGGHAVVPSLARDMKFPDHFDKVIDRAFMIAAGVSFIAGAAGYTMIGNGVSDEITRDMLQLKYGYSRTLNLFALWMIVIIPLTKFGLCSRPLNVTIETILGISIRNPRLQDGLSSFSYISRTVSSGVIQSSASSPSPSPISSPAQAPRRQSSSFKQDRGSENLSQRDRRRSNAQKAGTYFGTVISRTVVTVLTTLTAIYIPGFGRVMAFLGSFSAFLICIILPLAFWLKLAPRLAPEYTTPTQRVVHWTLMITSIGFMIAGTAWTFMPGSGHGGLEE